MYAVYKYGMRLRGCAPGCQPMDGLINAEDDPLDEYKNILTYSRKLTHTECFNFDLDFIRKEASG